MPDESGKFFNLYATAYVNGNREIRDMATVRAGDKIVTIISNQGNNASVCINGVCTTFKVRLPFITYALPVYFGGILPAPWDMKIDWVDAPFYRHLARSSRDILIKTLAFFGVFKSSIDR
jgi:hypothetical protein